MTLLINTGSYTLDASIQPIAALPGQFHLHFQSRLASAKHPLEPRTVVSTSMDRQGLLALNACIERALYPASWC